MRRGFSLVELLVAIGIIAVLIAILLPTLSRAREQARRAQCLSNLRQVHAAFLFYANTSGDQIPIGFRRTKQFNSLIWSNTANRFVLWGLFYQSRFLGDGKAFYCPSEVNPRFAHATAENPWPPGTDGNPSRLVQCGYALRPEVELVDDLTAAPAAFRMPRLIRFRNAAIASDLSSSPTRVRTRHVAGVNTLFGHGGARWIDRRTISPMLSQLPEPVATFDPVIDSRVSELWRAMDRE